MIIPYTELQFELFFGIVLKYCGEIMFKFNFSSLRSARFVFSLASANVRLRFVFGSSSEFGSNLARFWFSFGIGLRTSTSLRLIFGPCLIVLRLS